MSAGTGPIRFMPVVAQARRARARSISISSRPRWPDSPACGFSPSTSDARLAHPEHRAQVGVARCAATASRRAGVSAALTLRSGRCVVASATRMPPPTSIITGSGAPVCRARYSVCPVNAMPASLMTDFCTGAVTIASKAPAAQPPIGGIERVEHVARVGGIEPAGLAGRAQAARAAIRHRPGPVRRASNGVSCAASARASAATRPNSVASPISTTRQSRGGDVEQRASRCPGRCRPARRW